jgi:hypothetical protein
MALLDPGARSFRLASVALRTAHLAAMALLVGELAGPGPGARLWWWQGGTAVTGLLLLATEAAHGGRTWPFQVRGLAALVHLGLAGLAAHRPGPAPAIAALVVGAVASHLPRGLRKWSLRHGRVVD